MDDKYPFELVHLKSCRFSLGVLNRTSTCNLASRYELSRFPILVSILKLMHSYYCRLIKLPSDRLLYKLYQTDKINSSFCMVVIRGSQNLDTWKSF